MSDDIRKGQDSSDAHEGNSASPVNNSGADLSRRKFSKTGLVAAPVIMTLASRPALGAYQCSVSGAISGNLSNIDDSIPCGSKSPGWWKNNADSIWLVAGYTRDVKFHSVFSSTTYDYGDMTLQEVMDAGGTQDPYRVGFQAVGALLNAGYFTDASSNGSFGFNQYQIIYAWDHYSGDRESLAHDLEILNHRWDEDYMGPVTDLNFLNDWMTIPAGP